MKTIRLVGHLVVLEPLRRNKSDTGVIHYDMTRMDDRRQWKVLVISPAIAEKGLHDKGDLLPGDHVITQGLIEPLYEFDDKVIIANASWIVAIVGAPEDRFPPVHCGCAASV